MTTTGAGPALHGRLDILASYHYFKSGNDMAELVESRRVRIIADSGAFSAYTQGSVIKLAEYATWLRTWRPNLYWCASLDVFGDADATYTNWATLRDTYGLETVPTLHIGADPARMDAYAAQGVDFLGLGGMVGMPRSSILRWLVHVLRYARDRHPAMRFHAWGMSTPEFLEKLPLYSVDSSGLLTKASKFGMLVLWDPRKRKAHNIKLDGTRAMAHRTLLADVYNTRADQILRSNGANRTLLMRIGAYSAQLRAAHLQERHKVPAPQWGINPADRGHPGTRLHLVSQITDYRQVLRHSALHPDPTTA